MQKSVPQPFSSATPTGGRKMAKMILMISLRRKAQSAKCYTRLDQRQAVLTRAR